MEYIKHSINGTFTHYSMNEGRMSFGKSPGNSQYDDMLAEVEAGTSTITEQDDTPIPTWEEKRTASKADGGYGTWGEQFEMIGEGTMAAYKTHIAAVKTRHPK